MILCHRFSLLFQPYTPLLSECVPARPPDVRAILIPPILIQPGPLCAQIDDVIGVDIPNLVKQFDNPW